MQWSLFVKIGNGFKPINTSQKSSISDASLALATSLHFELTLTESKFVIPTRETKLQKCQCRECVYC